MSISSILFSRDRKPSVSEAINRPDEILQNSLVFVGGNVFVQGGLQIDARLKNCTIQAMDGKPIVLTALGKMEDCFIKGEDVLICGDFSGEIQAKGDVEVTNTARMSGTIRAGGHALVSQFAGEKGEITVGRLPLDEVEDVTAKGQVDVEVDDQPRNAEVRQSY